MPTINVHNYKTRQEAIDLVSSLDLTKVHHVKVTCKRGKRSIDQNALMWLWLNCISQETGYNKDELHDYFKQKYLGFIDSLIFGEDYKKPVTTTRLDTSQFKQYLEKVQIFAATELGITLPNPDDQHFEQFKDHYQKYI